MSGVSELGLSLAAGSLTTLSPCVFPLLPLVVGGTLQCHRAAPLATSAQAAGSRLNSAAVLLVAVAYASRAGFGLVLLGLAILAGFDKRIETRFNDWLPESWLYWLTRF